MRDAGGELTDGAELVGLSELELEALDGLEVLRELPVLFEELARRELDGALEERSIGVRTGIGGVDRLEETAEGRAQRRLVPEITPELSFEEGVHDGYLSVKVVTVIV